MALGIATVTPKITEPSPEPAVQTTPTADLTAVETEPVVETPPVYVRRQISLYRYRSNQNCLT